MLAEACAFKRCTGMAAWHVAEVVFVPVLNDTWLFRDSTFERTSQIECPAEAKSCHGHGQNSTGFEL